MNPSRRGLIRLFGVGSAAVVISVPIVLIASTWKPLEPPPSGSSDDEAEQPERPRRRDRQEEEEQAP